MMTVHKPCYVCVRQGLARGCRWVVRLHLRVIGMLLVATGKGSVFVEY